MGRRKFIAARLATQMFSCWLEEALLRGIIRPPRARLLKRALQGKRRSYMFLKTEQFEYNGVSVTLSELSALQRIEHL
ncbi:hypothetical protein MMN71_27450, partial [Escherichia coli]|nr:hypothetical protein [Escherichia coli]MCM4919378.1 hypothetical protein [Escherichia coli]